MRILYKINTILMLYKTITIRMLYKTITIQIAIRTIYKTVTLKCCLLGRDDVSTDKYLQICRRKFLPPSSKCTYEAKSKCLGHKIKTTVYS